VLRRWPRGAGAATRAGFWGFQGKQCSHDASAVVGVPEGALAAVKPARSRQGARWRWVKWV